MHLQSFEPLNKHYNYLTQNKTKCGKPSSMVSNNLSCML